MKEEAAIVSVGLVILKMPSLFRAEKVEKEDACMWIAGRGFLTQYPKNICLYECLVVFFFLRNHVK